MIGTDCIGSSKSNHHIKCTITTTPSTKWVVEYCLILIKKKKTDGQQYQQNKQSPDTSTHWTQNKQPNKQV